jgi:DNA-binding CsgD family transcriptional regulator/tetratricopeptide (TPR) repeat protein
MRPAGTPVDLVGRDRELARLVAVFDRCRSSRRGAVAVLHGAVGIGTSAVGRAVHAALDARGLPHTWWHGRCTRTVQTPYEPVAGLLRDVPGDVAEWIAEGAAAGPELAPVALVAGLARRMRAAAADRPLVVFVDDADGADASTTRLLQQVVHVLDDVPVFLVLAGRSDPDGDGPLLGLDLGGLDLGAVEVEVVEMNALDPEALAELVRRRSAGELPEGDVDGPLDDGPLDDASVATIVAASGGRPAVAVALATAGDAASTSAAVLAAIHPAAADVTFAASLADGWLPTAGLTAVIAGLSEGPLDGGIVALLVRRGVLAAPDAVVAGGPRGPVVASELWRMAAQRVDTDRRRGIAAAVAAAIEPHAPAATRAVALEAAGDRVAAGDAWWRAAEHAAESFAVETAAAAARRAIDLGGARILAVHGRRAGEWCLAAGDRVAADEIAAAATPHVPRTDPVTEVALSVLRYRARSEAGLGDAERHLAHALSLRVPPCRERVDALVIHALVTVLDDASVAAISATEAEALAEALDDDATTARAVGATGLVAAIEGRLDDALACFDRAVAAAAAAGDGATEARLASNRVYVLWRAGRYADVVDAAELELDRLRVRGLEALGDQLAIGRCAALVTLGRLDAARAAVASARAMRLAADAATLLDVVGADLALLTGDSRQAESLLDEIRRSPAADVPEVVADRWRLELDVALARGDRAAAASAAEEGLRTCGSADTIATTRLVLGWWRAAAADARDPLVIDVPAPVGAESRALVAEIAAHRLPVGGRAAAWDAAVAAWAAIPAPFEVIRTRAYSARDRGDLAQLQVLVDEATAIGVHGLAAQIDAMWRAAGGRRPGRRSTGLLTEREVEVLALVAEGLTNREIGERLYIGVKTVGSHLEKAMAKLGSATRGAAVHEARRLGLLD